MAKITRKSAKIFAEGANAAVGGISQFGSLAAGTPNYSKDPDVIQGLSQYSQGWSAAVLGTKSPALEDRNALDFLLSYQQAYIMQRGIPEWLDTETYYQGSFASKSNGVLYVSKVDNNTNHDPEEDTSETYWIKFPTPAEVAATYVKKAGDTMTGGLAVQNDISSTGNVSANTFTATTSMTTSTPSSSSNDTTVPTTEWVNLKLGDLNMLGRMDFSSAIAVTISGPTPGASSPTTYTCPSDGYMFFVSTSTGGGSLLINDSQIVSEICIGSYMPVSQGDILKTTSSNKTFQFTFVPQISN